MGPVMKLYRVVYVESNNKQLPESCAACEDSGSCTLKQEEGISPSCEFFIEGMNNGDEVRMRVKPS